MSYLLDSDVFIQAKNLHYGFDVCPAFWDWFIAAALAGDHVVVTHEIASATLRRVKIPNVCVGLGVDFMSPFQMLRKAGARFVLGPTDQLDSSALR